MRKLYLLVTLSVIYFRLSAQILYVTSGTDLSISSGTTFSAGGLSLAPSSVFTLNGIQLDLGATVTHSTPNTYVSRVYKFSANTPSYNGVIQFFYNDGELNGLTESSLQVNVHDGTSWTSVTSNLNDVTNNYVLTNSISSKVLNELTLASSLNPLPLSWGKIYASRQNNGVLVQWETLQENNVAYFNVERSSDGINWTTVVSTISAHNTNEKSGYSATDENVFSSRLYYRIKQVDVNNHFSFSSTIILPASNEEKNLVAYPNPVKNIVYLNNFSTAAITQVDLYSNSGAIVKSWKNAQPFYDLNQFSAGIYFLLVHLNNGETRKIKLNKQ